MTDELKQDKKRHVRAPSTSWKACLFHPLLYVDPVIDSNPLKEIFCCYCTHFKDEQAEAQTVRQAGEMPLATFHSYVAYIWNWRFCFKLSLFFLTIVIKLVCTYKRNRWQKNRNTRIIKHNLAGLCFLQYSRPLVASVRYVCVLLLGSSLEHRPLIVTPLVKYSNEHRLS